MSQSEHGRHDELERAALECGRELDEAGYIVTIRGEVDAGAVSHLTGVPLRVLRRWRDLEQGPPSSRTVRTVALYPIVDVLRWINRDGAAS